MLRKKDAASLDPWIDDAKNSLIAFFARGAMEDKAAVRADIDSPWANRQARDRSQSLNS
jgi:transposase